MQNENQQDLVKELTAASLKAFDIDGVPHILVPEKYRLESKKDLINPRFIEIHKSVCETSSFIEYLKKFANADTAIFECAATNQFDCYVDYHGVDAPKRLKHTITLDLQTDSTWNVFKKADRNYFDQEQFAEFVEEYLPYFLDPDGSTLMEIVNTLQSTKQIQFNSAQRLHNGSVSLQYIENNGASAGVNGELQIPEKIIFGMPIYKAGSGYRYTARLRYRITPDRKLKFAFLINDLQAYLDHALKEVRDQIKAALPEIPIYKVS